jgi:hypothetical protein
MRTKKIPRRSSKDTMSDVIASLRSCSSKNECLHCAYDVLTTRYHGDRLKTVGRLWQLYPSSMSSLWKRKGFLHCTNANRLLHFLLIESGHFTDHDIKLPWTIILPGSPHQYLRARIGKAWINVDIWAKAYGIAFGSYAKGWIPLRKK